MKNKNKLLLLTGIGAVITYRAIRGRGIFNKIRFKKQHLAILSYCDTHYPGAHIGEIIPFKEGWNCCITHNNQKILLYIIDSGRGGYIFTQIHM